MKTVPLEVSIIFYVFMVLYFLLALISKFFYPKKINSLAGFRTTKSMKNQENWIKAQKLFGNYFSLWVSVFNVFLLLSICLFGLSLPIFWIEIVGLGVLPIILIIVVNRKL